MTSSIIAELNDAFRTTFVGGTVCITNGIEALEPSVRASIIEAVRNFDNFEPDNDPYGEHDFGTISLKGVKAYWKIDAYNKSLAFGSPDPSNCAVTKRVLTIMLAEEY